VTDPFRHPWTLRLVDLALEEDLGRGDVTTAATIAPGTAWAGTVSTREPVVVAGVPLLAVVFERFGARIEVKPVAQEGERVAAGRDVVRLRGDAAALLGAERTILNFLQRLSGVATLTRRFVDAVAGTGATIVDTRKTTPGWRLLDKYAVRTGGGANHRFGLDDGILIKDNHVTAAGGVRAAVERARAHAPHLLRVEVECDTLGQVDEAIDAGADVILLDNMSLDEMRRAVAAIRSRAPRVVVEASGGMALDRVRAVAATGVELISVGALTHSAPAVDLTLHLSPRRPRKSLRAKRVSLSTSVKERKRR
jgi:nicotinate-nucleotide pyrophosphorylase (carboxylating)